MCLFMNILVTRTFIKIYFFLYLKMGKEIVRWKGKGEQSISEMDYQIATCLQEEGEMKKK